MRGLITASLLLLAISCQGQQPFLEAGAGVRVGIWQYNLGENSQGDYAGEGLHYTHFSPFFPFYLQSGLQFEKWEGSLGGSYTLFLDNEFRVHQNPGTFIPNIYTFTEGYVHLIHVYGQLQYYLIRKEQVRLGPVGSAGIFRALNEYPLKGQLESRWFLEGGIRGLFRVGSLWLSIYPVYQWNIMQGPSSTANHQLFSFGGMIGLRKELNGRAKEKPALLTY